MKKGQTMKAVLALVGSGEQALYAHDINNYVMLEMLPKEILDNVLRCFYADSLWWVPALRYMHERARNERFKQALHDNIRCETGEDGGIPHLTMIDAFMESIGLKVDMKDPIYAGAVSRAQDENRMLHRATEPQKAGFMLATEALFPVALKLIRPAIVCQYPDADMHYIDEHIQVDADEHAEWMKESVQQILASSSDTFDEIAAGIEEASSGAIFPFEHAMGPGQLIIRL